MAKRWLKRLELLDNVASKNTGRKRPYIFDYGKYDEEQFRSRYRVTKAAFRELLDIISPDISAHKDQGKPIPADIQLLLTLRFYTTGTTIQANTWTNSVSTVDINLGLRYITVSCACVDSDRNFDTTGKRSKIMATIPVTSEQNLNSSLTFYDNIHSVVSVLNGDHNMFELDVNTNILGNKVDLSVMFELYFE